MRPLRLVLLLACFVALPIFLTCLSLFGVHEGAADSFNTSNHPSSSRFRTLFSFHTPSSLFPPSAIISLTYDNSTFFLARPAAFGPLLPSKGLSGQLWVGRGFGDAILNGDGEFQVNGWELGCSDVPGWTDGDKKRTEHLGSHDKPWSKAVIDKNTSPGEAESIQDMHKKDKTLDAETDPPAQETLSTGDDGTDDHLHHPLPDSNPAKSGQPGVPAAADQSGDKTRMPTHADIESLQESADIAGKIVLLSRGGCGFLEKVKWAQRRGGIAVVVGDNEQGAALTVMYAKGDISNVTIPAIFTSYTSAHLLSSLVPPDQDDKEYESPRTGDKADHGKGRPRGTEAGPTFTSVKTAASLAGPSRPTIISASRKKTDMEQERGWAQNMLSAVGLNEDASHLVEDSRRPPSSGNIDWVLVEDWDDEDLKQKTAKGKPVTAKQFPSSVKATPRPPSSSSRRPSADDFVIGVQDWRDTDLVAPKSTVTTDSDKQIKDQSAPVGQQLSSSFQAPHPAHTDALKGGSITPGSGEYDHQKLDDVRARRPGNAEKVNGKPHGVGAKHRHSSWLQFWKWGKHQSTEDQSSRRTQKSHNVDANASHAKPDSARVDAFGEEHQGLWVTLTPTSVSTSPFFDTLLVLVVSPLVTLTVVYALLLLRSRIRRRRWRAPKSVVERLPVRTYHTMSTSSSTTSSNASSRNNSSPTSPLLPSAPQDVHPRSRPRSQTTTGIITSTSAGSSLSQIQQPLPIEKSNQKPASTKRKRYTGRQVECVVCLEEYVDGESRVMSLPCGHEFHAECITPWLVTRRRTCPICKGDVVRSMARNGPQPQEEIRREEGEETSDDVQDRVVETVNNAPSAAIPIPVRDEDDAVEEAAEDIERGDTDQDQETRQGARSSWRNFVSNGVNALSGETVWRSTPVDRSR